MGKSTINKAVLTVVDMANENIVEIQLFEFADDDEDGKEKMDGQFKVTLQTYWPGLKQDDIEAIMDDGYHNDGQYHVSMIHLDARGCYDQSE